MANTLLTSSVIARAALATLYERCVMLPLVTRDYESEFMAGRGATVNVRKPATFTANEYNGTTITVQNATETSVPVVLNHHRDVSFAVTSRDRALNIIDFTQQFIAPAMEALFIAVDTDILGLRSDVVNLVGDGVGAGLGVGYTTAYTDSDVLVDARTVLSKAKVPLGQRNLVVPEDLTRYWLKEDAIKQVDASGSTEALREASLGGRISGFTPYETNNISDAIGVGFHPTAFAFVNRPLAIPAGVTGAAVESYKGLSIRVVPGYDMQLKSEIYSLDILYGVKTLDASRAVLIDGSGS